MSEENMKVLIATILSGIWSGDVKLKEPADKAIDEIASTVTSLQHRLQESKELLRWLKNLAENFGIEFRRGVNQETDRILKLIEGDK